MEVDNCTAVCTEPVVGEAAEEVESVAEVGGAVETAVVEEADIAAAVEVAEAEVPVVGMFGVPEPESPPYP